MSKDKENDINDVSFAIRLESDVVDTLDDLWNEE